jgi:hypothetical protein
MLIKAGNGHGRDASGECGKGGKGSCRCTAGECDGRGAKTATSMGGIQTASVTGRRATGTGEMRTVNATVGKEGDGDGRAGSTGTASATARSGGEGDTLKGQRSGSLDV